jgi:hypothetical protein
VAFLTGGRLRSASVRDGGWRHLPLSGAPSVDPTDGDIARVARTRRLSPAERLREAVFICALNELHRYPADTPVGAEVRRWFASDEQVWPYAFVPICDGIGLDPSAVRRRVLGPERQALDSTVLIALVRRVAAR